MITIGNNKIANNVISFNPDLFEGHIGYFKIAEVPQSSEEGSQYSISLLGTGGGNYADNVDGISYAYVCVHRGSVRAGYDTVIGNTYLDWYYRINDGVVEIWVSPKQQFPNFISILVMRNNFNRWTIGNLEQSRELPDGLVDF